MIKIVIILPYFGVFPNYFQLFLNSCYHNQNIDFLIFTDNQLVESQNIRVIHMDWKRFIEMIQNKFDFKINIPTPYKLCDFRPAYGYIFEDFIKDYDYWGHCDADLIWGNLSLLQPLLTNGFERIGTYGHLMLYKNDYDVNRWFINLNSPRVPNYKDVFSTDLNLSFDEFAGMNILLTDNHKKVCDKRLFDDIIFYSSNLYSRRDFLGIKLKHNTPQIFHYNKGKLFRRVWMNNQWNIDESLYVHLQKRKMEIKIDDIDNYFIIPNKFINSNMLDEELGRIKGMKFDLKYHTYIIKAKFGNFLKQKFGIS